MSKKKSSWRDLVNQDSIEEFGKFVTLNIEPDNKRAIYETDLFEAWQCYCREFDLPYGIMQVYDQLIKGVGLDKNKHTDGFRFIRGAAWKEDAEHIPYKARNYPDPLSKPRTAKKRSGTLW